MVHPNSINSLIFRSKWTRLGSGMTHRREKSRKHQSTLSRYYQHTIQFYYVKKWKIILTLGMRQLLETAILSLTLQMAGIRQSNTNYVTRQSGRKITLCCAFITNISGSYGFGHKELHASLCMSCSIAYGTTTFKVGGHSLTQLLVVTSDI